MAESTEPKETDKLVDHEEPPAIKTVKRDGTRVFKKTSPNTKITVYVGKRDFVDHVTEVDPLDGVILIDPEYFKKEAKKDRKVFAQILVGFRYGRDDLDVLGLNYRRDLLDERIQVYPPPDPSKPQILTLLQVRLLKKLGRNAYPFTFSLKPGLPSSVSLQPSPNASSQEGEKPCGVDFILRCYVAKNKEDKIEKRNSVRLSVKKITHASDEHTQRPSIELTKQYLLSSHPLTVEANLDKGTYYHGEPIRVNVSITNRSSKTIRKIRVSVRQFAAICLFANSEYKCTVAELESSEGLPIGTGGSLQKSYEITPLLKDNRNKKGLALDGQIKHEDTCLASSTILPSGVEDSRELRESFGIVVHYSVKVRCIVNLGSDLTLELPFTLTHPKPKERVISQVITLPPRSSLSSITDPKDDKSKAPPEAKPEGIPADDTVSVHDVIDHNLITFDTDDATNDQDDFVFEEFVRLRVTGMDDNNETEA
ncbi:PREDICTED: beta-arrestin-2-like isoform X1 [Amphimedon queenslandica]|uniref:Arrestin C-terminal-like domain-containing protein n=1 Tax=Amphimedon queenslandica TaxID=400682 RepID=A0A1X7VP04_AMPQE|nr:PREDICTED: beta-arrestin-2-like isoform X1 [Amphimedon queenslandica]XP_019864234.1 PREDICTED: beta-arrestin-2-like isoform X1 [Amphimedon queenslandica]|eukprot:XP_019864233.1 PREDICTED: beta-arrestin-2-like isoform X1 [Amphimedon queenslandica]